MVNERESLPVLKFTDYNISGNEFRAYYDAAHKLVFVIDSTMDERKPNVLLIINPVGDRKWDDILANDYAIDLETIRPKKDNKYQKLDIEYNGLSEYDDLIHAYEDGDDITDALTALSAFRDASVHRAATERLNMALATAAKTRDTITKTRGTIQDLKNLIKRLRTRLSEQRQDIGREPTKKTAAKILRTEAQIDANSDKLRRAQRRLEKAEKRLADAEADATDARHILAQPMTAAPERKSTNVPARAPSTAVSTTIPEPIDAEFDDDNDDYDNDVDDDDIYAEPIAPVEPKPVKPLLDSDPEILDQEIAFKPIDFNINISATPTESAASEPVATPEPAPTTFAPPINVRPITDTKPVPEFEPEIDTETEFEYEIPEPAPVLDTIKPVEQTPQTDLAPEFEIISAPTPELSSDTPQAPNAEQIVTPAPTMPYTVQRPTSPITAPTPAPEPAPKRPSALYYVLLLALIALSIFTLWLYQKRTSDTIPALTTTAQTPEIVETAPIMEQPTKIIPVEPEILEIPEPVAAEPEPVIVDIPPEPVLISEPEPEPAPVVVEPEPVPEPVDVIVSPFIDTPSAEPVAEPEPEPAPVVVNKPEYNVSQNENMFVAAPEYDTETIVQAEESQCYDGNPPNQYGCCTGEFYTDMEDGTYMCCTEDGSECFEPLY